ncbi:glycoside hydrolase family 18 protein [Coniophora puteana RWD-64-598 SS2]|uniref:Glycoside hydrolase family 18 protein n=1 Tax=Coniophora puteana (strain RWD-64-598) TaxID=741705 RepID=A0A5M3MW68_CONPW|nr:glycoside hydrolase family 18 protein [Coniophora puteana RWD-64-598 SS2]EIW83398.1 glycoside hydrolase family 18 protein [Coniophora puteana RWD-64-598 SS2]
MAKSASDRGIYARSFPPTLIPAQDLTHLLYAFAALDSSGNVALSDPWADVQAHLANERWDEPGNNMFGCLKLIYALKQNNRHLKSLLSIGGWGKEQAFHAIVVDPAKRQTFVRRCIELLEDHGFDGIDVDYEYPSNRDQAVGFTLLLQELRMALDEHANAKRRAGVPNAQICRFLLSIAVSCGPSTYAVLGEPFPSSGQSIASVMDQSLDLWNLMAYDFAGASWSNVADHQANLKGEQLSGEAAINWYSRQGVPLSKMVLGLPLYGRSFANTNGHGQPHNGLPESSRSSWEQGVYDYRALPIQGGHMHEDLRKGASWSFDPRLKEFVTFDNGNIARMKGEYTKERGLAGSMFWELSGDKRDDTEGDRERNRKKLQGIGKDYVDGDSLVRVVRETMGQLDHTWNWLSYNGSKYDNIKNQMGRLQ